MSCCSTIGIHYYFSSGKTCISMRSTYYKTSGWDDIYFGMLIHHRRINCLINYLSSYVFSNCFLANLFIMLCRNNHSLKSYRLIILIILNRNLALTIRSKIWKSTIFPNLRKPSCKLMCQRNSVRHMLITFI